jgi:hypothetical protein
MERSVKIDNLVQSVDADNSNDVDLGEYIAWVTDTLGRYGQPIPPSLYQSYINHFYSYVLVIRHGVYLGVLSLT